MVDDGSIEKSALDTDAGDIKCQKSNAQQAGFFTSVSAAATTAFTALTATTFGNIPEAVSYAGAGSAAVGLVYTIYNAVDFNFKYAADFTKGFLTPPILAASLYLCEKNLDLSSHFEIEKTDNTKTIDCSNKDGLDEEIFCASIEAASDYLSDTKEEPNP